MTHKEAPMDISEGLREEIWNRLLPMAKNNINEVYVLSILPIIESRYPGIGSLNREYYHLNDDINKYNKFLKNICNKFKIKFIDISKSWNENNPEELLFDSGHPNDKGHEIIANEILKQIKRS